MHIFYRPLYKSDATEFIDSLKTANPALEATQRQGRNLLWDRPQDRQAQQDFNESRVAQQAYVYHTKG